MCSSDLTDAEGVHEDQYDWIRSSLVGMDDKAGHRTLGRRDIDLALNHRGISTKTGIPFFIYNLLQSLEMLASSEETAVLFVEMVVVAGTVVAAASPVNDTPASVAVPESDGALNC